MRIDKIRTLSGPNIYNYKPVLLMKLYLDELAETASCDVAGFNERLVARLPGLAEHHCSKGRAGGFVERLETSTYFGHIVEHVALELSDAAGVPVYYGKRECVTVLDEIQAFSNELREMKQGDMMVIFYDKLEPVLEVLARHGAVPAASIGEIVPQLRVATV